MLLIILLLVFCAFLERHLAISESGRSEESRRVYERGVLQSQNLVAEFLQAAMKLGKLQRLIRLWQPSLLESELLERFPVPTSRRSQH